MKLARIRSLVFASLGVIVLLPSPAMATCSPSETCSDVSVSLVGQLDVDTITVSWSTNSEDATVGYYAIKRYDCGTPATCSVDVTTIPAVGSCNDPEPYSYEDEPPSPVGSWTYTVEVWRTDNTRACAVDVEPE